MNAPSVSSPLDEYRLQARLLLKDLRSESGERQHTAARRFLTLRALGDGTIEGVVASRATVRLKHALIVVAAEHGHGSWTDLKEAVESRAGVDDATLMYTSGFDVLLNRWFAHYDQARDSLEQVGGYLLPYRNQFLVCEGEAIRLLGLDPGDPDWARIGHDWVQPADRAAWRRLRARRVAVLAATDEGESR